MNVDSFVVCRLSSSHTGEIDDLRANGAETLNQRTRYGGRGNDAYKQERQLDQDLMQEGGRDLVDENV